MSKVELLVEDSSRMDENLIGSWYDSEIGEWTDFILSLDPNIINCKRNTGEGFTIIIFETEAHKNWFILRWS